MKKIISLIFALLLIATAVFSMTSLAFAAEEAEGDGEAMPAEFPDYTAIPYAYQEQKLATMTLMLESNGYQLYIQEDTAEVAVVHMATGQILFTNPYSVATSRGTEDTKNKLLSQIIIKYTENGVSKEYNSYADSAKLGQIIIKEIKNGIRVEYTIGRANANYLVPRRISKERLETEILQYIDSNFYKNKITAFYDLKDPNAIDVTPSIKEEMERTYPVTKDFPIYVLSADIKNRELAQMESIIKTYAPDYTYEEMEFDHQQTQYEATALSTPVFRLSLEYTLTEDGLQVTLPANGIRFDETLYTLEDITFLPFMGAGNYLNDGYTFIPDGSGAIMDFADFQEKNTAIAGTVYGTDFAYQKLEGAANQDVMRMPVFGLRETIPANRTSDNVDVDRGFFAIITEGDALARITAKHENQLHDYNTVQLSFNPRPKDSYSLTGSVSAGGASGSEISVVSDRKYVGSYTVKYIMLLDDEKAEENGVSDYYETTWMGMARAYRDYLTETGILTRLEKSDVDSSIPLYIETFGATETVEKVLSIPTTVSKALTTFDNVITMRKQLAEEGITNIDFKLTGYANGGMYASIPYNLDWEGAVGGKDGYNKLIKDAEENGYGVYPDFDFAYVRNQRMFDGLDLGRDIVKTIDNRYSSLREYDASLQEFVSYFTLCVSPSAYDNFYNNFSGKFLAYGNKNISVATLGYSLNSDFDEDEPYNREDSKDFTMSILGRMDKDMTNVMSESGNVYTWKYVDKMLGVSLQSSRLLYASASVPFTGVVLHGSIEFTGSAINMAGDVDYEILKAIENGAGLYFILSFDNTELLKEDVELSKYYSVRYDIWKEELVDRYTELNKVLADVQTSLIVEHEFLIGERVPTAEELEADLVDAEIAEAEANEAEETDARKKAIADMRAKYLAGEIGPGEPIVPVIEEKTKAEPEGYQYTKYTSDDNSIVRVTYENGKTFILNYNSFAITTVVEETTYTVPGYGYVVID